MKRKSPAICRALKVVRLISGLSGRRLLGDDQVILLERISTEDGKRCVNCSKMTTEGVSLDAAHFKNILGRRANEYAPCAGRVRARELDSQSTRFPRTSRAPLAAEEEPQAEDGDCCHASPGGFHSPLCDPAPCRCRGRLLRRKFT